MEIEENFLHEFLFKMVKEWNLGRLCQREHIELIDVINYVTHRILSSK